MATKARLEATALVLVVFLLGALLGGVGNHMWNQRVAGEPLASSGTTPGAGPARGPVMNALCQQIQLTAEQQKQLDAIIVETRGKYQALYAPLDGPKEQIRQEGRASIRAILTPDQHPKFDEFLRHLDEQRKKDAAAGH